MVISEPIAASPVQAGCSQLWRCEPICLSYKMSTCLWSASAYLFCKHCKTPHVMLHLCPEDERSLCWYFWHLTQRMEEILNEAILDVFPPFLLPSQHYICNFNMNLHRNTLRSTQVPDNCLVQIYLDFGFNDEESYDGPRHWIFICIHFHNSLECRISNKIMLM